MIPPPNNYRPILLIPAAIIGLAAWHSMDMRSILKSSQRYNQLSIEGRWQEVDSHFERAAKSRRPFVWLHRRYFLPGSIATQHALFLHKQGREAEALARVDQAIRQIEGKPRLFRTIHERGTLKMHCGALRARSLILAGLGRYDDARQAAAQLHHLAGPKARPHTALAMLEFYCGHLDEALAQAREVPLRDPQYDSACLVTALAHSTKGEFAEALQALRFQPADITKYYSTKGLEDVGGIPEGAKLIELQRKKMAGVFQPARLLMMTQVYLGQGDFANAVQTLDQVEKSIGPEPGLQFAYARHRAYSLAAQGKPAEAESYLERLRAITRQYPKRSRVWEMHYATGHTYFHLGRFGEGLCELLEAQRSVLHPIEKHTTAYWIARTLESDGKKSEAVPYYQSVATDPIPSWMQKKAAATLNPP